MASDKDLAKAVIAHVKGDPLPPFPNWKKRELNQGGYIFTTYCPACGFDCVWQSSIRFCHGKKRPWYWPFSGKQCLENRPHIHASCTDCKWEGIFGANKL